MKDKDIVEEKAQKLLETTAAFCKEYLDDLKFRHKDDRRDEGRGF